MSRFRIFNNEFVKQQTKKGYKFPFMNICPWSGWYAEHESHKKLYHFEDNVEFTGIIKFKKFDYYHRVAIFCVNGNDDNNIKVCLSNLNSIIPLLRDGEMRGTFEPCLVGMSAGWKLKKQ